MGEPFKFWIALQSHNSSLGRRNRIRDNMDDSSYSKSIVVLIFVSPRKGICRRGCLLMGSMDNSTKLYNNCVMVSR